MKVKVIGKGCNHYYELLELVKSIINKKNKNIQVEEIFENHKIAELGIKNFPALMIDGKLISEGVNYDTEEIQKLLAV